MRTSRIAAPAVAALLAIVAPTLTAQSDPAADFGAAREQIARGDPQHAALTIALASVYVRQQVGRCHDAGLGTRMLAAESRLDALSARLRASAAPAATALDAAFAATDRLLAEHFWRMAEEGWKDQRNVPTAAVGHDLGSGAMHLERALRGEGRAPGAETLAAIADARRIGAQLVHAPDKRPAETGRIIDALGRQIVGTVVTATAQ